MDKKMLILIELRILSITEKSAQVVTFDPKRNLITGENDVGKSSIIKSIYHTLGADIEFDSQWGKAGAIGYLSFSYCDVKFSVLRSRSHIAIFDQNGSIIEAFDSIIKGLSPFFAKFFNNKLVLKKPQSAGRIPVSPAMQFLPFYIDQDKSWTNPWSAFEGLGAFSGFKTDLIEFFVGIRPNEYYFLSEKLEIVSAKLLALRSEESALTAAKKTVEKHTPKILFDIDIKVFKKEIDLLVVKLESLKSKQFEYRKNIIKQKNQNAYIDNEIDVLKKSISEITSDYECSINHLKEEVTCPTCNAIYENSMISRFGMLEDVDTCRSLLADYLEEKKKLANEISQLENKLNIQTLKVREITYILNVKKGNVKLADLIQNESAKKVKEIFNSSQINYAAQIAKAEEEAEKIKEKRKGFNNKDRKEYIINKFKKFLEVFLFRLNVHNIDIRHINTIPHTIKAQGSDGPRALLAYYFAILYTSKKFTDLPIFPLVIDSPNQQDQDTDNRSKIIKFIVENTPSNYQLILGTVDLHGVEFKGKVISPTKKLKVLDVEQYDATYKLIAPLLDKMHENLLLNGIDAQSKLSASQ